MARRGDRRDESADECRPPFERKSPEELKMLVAATTEAFHATLDALLKPPKPRAKATR